jgi:hypothetical protein
VDRVLISSRDVTRVGGDWDEIVKTTNNHAKNVKWRMNQPSLDLVFGNDIRSKREYVAELLRGLHKPPKIAK